MLASLQKKIMKKLIFDSNEEKLNIGLLALRILIGFMFVLHGTPKLFGGLDTWNFVGSSMGFLGLKSGYAFWGFLAALTEFAGGILLIVGLLVRPASVFLLFTMLVAIIFHYAKDEGFNGAAHAMEDAIVFIFLIIAGGGKYALDTKLIHTNAKRISLQ